MPTTYNIQRSASQSGPWTTVATGLSGSPANLVTQAANQTWYYQAQSQDSFGGTSAWSNIAAVVTLDAPVLTATPGASFITLTWPAVTSDTAGYKVYRYHPTRALYVYYATVAGTSFVDYAVGTALTYLYKVTALAPDGGESALSNSASASLSSGGIFSMARSTVFQGVQIGFETTPGTLVAATRRLIDVELTPTPMHPVKVTRYAGSKANGMAQLGQSHTEAKFQGVWDFNMLPYWFTSMFGAPTLNSLNSGAAYQRLWTPSPITPTTPKTLTIEQGSSIGAEKFGYGIVSGMHLKWGKEEATIDGDMFGQTTVRNASMTASLPELVRKPVNFNNIGVYLSTDGSTFTKLTADLDGEIRLGGLFQPVFHVNDSNSSFDDYKEMAPDFGVTLTLEESKNTETDNFMTYLTSGQLVYLGIKATGALISSVPSNVNYLMRIYLPCYITKPAPGDKSGLWGNTFTFEIAHDAAFGLAQVEIINALATLN